MGIWLTVVIGITQLALGGMGVYVSLRPPKKEHHWYWIAGFIVVGLSGVALTGWLARTGDDAQRQATKEVHEAQVAATDANVAATNANTAAMAAQQEMRLARGEAHKATGQVEKLIDQRSIETQKTITTWQASTDNAVRQLVQPHRTLTADQRNKFVAALENRPSGVRGGGHIELLFAPNEESQRYAEQLQKALEDAKWNIVPAQHDLDHPPSGIYILTGNAKKIPAEASDLLQALRAVGIQVVAETTGHAADNGSIVLLVGYQ